MSDPVAAALREAWPRALAALHRHTGALERAEDSLQDAVLKALARWPDEGIPDRPHAWLIRVGSRKATDRVRKAQRAERLAPLWEEVAAKAPWQPPDLDGWPDDLLRILVTTCDPVLGTDERAALTLATAFGLATAELARVFGVQPRTMEQRLGRARKRLRLRRGRLPDPEPEVASERIHAVLAVIHLAHGEAQWSPDVGLRDPLQTLCLRLATVLCDLVPDDGEVLGLRALLELYEVRRPGRLDSDGQPVPLDRQDRTRWDRDRFGEAEIFLLRALSHAPPGPLALEAAISAVHTRAITADATDWQELAWLLGALHTVHPTPWVAVDRAHALGMAGRPADGLSLLDGLDPAPLEGWPFLPLVRGTLLQGLDRDVEAAEAFARASALARGETERAAIADRLARLGHPDDPGEAR